MWRMFTALWLVACATAPAPVRWELFAPLPEDDEFAPEILHWQAETRIESLTAQLSELRAELDGNGAAPPPAAPPPASALGQAYLEFRGELRHRVVRETVAWVQQQSGLYYKRDRGPDDWPVLAELLERGTDDCDGMDLLTFSLLRQLGFGPGEIYRAIVRNVETGRHHIVTLWLEPGHEDDPWLLDSTGQVSREVIPLSAQRAWEPVRVFDEKSAYVARAR